MDSKDLGRIIRNIRLEKKMTQSEVVGSFITRNMLSKIESGSAVPSLPTLDYLAKALDVPLSRLLPDENDEGGNSDASTLLIKTKAALNEGQYEQAIKLANKLPTPFFDEKEAICARAYLFLAKENLKKKEFDKACESTKLSLDKAKKGIYSSRDLQTEALLILDTANEGMEKR